MRKFPNALVIMIGFIIFASILTYIIPQGTYERTIDPESGITKVVPNSYQIIEAESVSFFETFIAIPEGIIERADLIALILLIGGCFYVIEKTGALKEGIEYLTTTLKGKEEVILVLVALVFMTGGALNGLQEEIIAMTPVLLYLAARMGYNAFVALSISYGAAILGASFSPINPFAVVIAQNETELPFLSGAVFRLVVLAIAFSVFMFMVIRYANKNRVAKSEVAEEVTVKIKKSSVLILGLVAVSFAILIYGMLQLNWGFNEMTAEFFILGIVVGLIGKLGINGTSEAYLEGFKELVFAAMIVGLASSISIILKKGMIIDSIVYGLFLPMQYLPESLSALSMMVSQSLLHIPVPSYSGQAILTMPILAPLSDLIGLSRQVCVLAYQYGAVMMDLLTPTNGSLMAVIAIAGISFNKWFKFALKFVLVTMGVGAVAIIAAIYMGI
jgi:uncharacterized ion transporter superfamily protein YfcC